MLAANLTHYSVWWSLVVPLLLMSTLATAAFWLLRHEPRQLRQLRERLDNIAELEAQLAAQQAEQDTDG